jgi:hypothetical protein
MSTFTGTIWLLVWNEYERVILDTAVRVVLSFYLYNVSLPIIQVDY